MSGVPVVEPASTGVVTAPGSEVCAIGRYERLLVPSAIGAVTLLFLGIARSQGALGAARNDDWAYLRVTDRFVNTGRFSFDGWTQMSFVGQAVLAWPVGRLFGSSIAAYQVFVAALGAVGLVAIWWTVRMWLTPLLAGAVVASVLAGPIYGSVAVSFMSDVPALAATSICVLAAAQLSRRFSLAWLATACVSGIAAVSIREYGLVPLVVALAAGLSGDVRGRRVSAAMAVLSIAACAALLSWRRGIESGPAVDVVLSADRVLAGVGSLCRAAITLAFLVAPWGVAAFVRDRLWSSDWRRAALLCLAWGAVLWRSEVRFTGNYLSPTGSYTPLIEGELPDVIPWWLQQTARATAAVSLLGLLGALTQFLPRRGACRWGGLRRALGRRPVLTPRRTVALTLSATLGMHGVLVLLTDAPFFDRYLIAAGAWSAALLSPVAGCTLKSSRVGGAVVGFAVLACLLISARLVVSAMALDGGAWRTAERLAVDHHPASIDAGFAWFGYHQTGPVAFEQHSGRNWWTSFYPQQPICNELRVEPRGRGVAFGVLTPGYGFEAHPTHDPRCPVGP